MFHESFEGRGGEGRLPFYEELHREFMDREFLDSITITTTSIYELQDR
jgi:hypothetical protein